MNHSKNKTNGLDEINGPQQIINGSKSSININKQLEGSSNECNSDSEMNCIDSPIVSNREPDDGDQQMPLSSDDEIGDDYELIYNIQVEISTDNEEDDLSKTSSVSQKKTANGKRKKQFSCTKCNYKCRKKAHLNRHERKHAGNNENSGTITTTTSATSAIATTSSPTSTATSTTTTNTNDEPNGIENNKIFYCTMCNYKTDRAYAFKCHSLNHVIDKPLLDCAHCDYKGKNVADLQQHELLHNNENYYINNGPVIHHTYENLILCAMSLCDCAEIQLNIFNHLLSNNRKANDDCDDGDGDADDDDDAGIDDEPNYSIQLNNFEQTSYSCPLCDFKTNHLQHFKYHEKCHRESNLQCSECNFKGESLLELKRHERTHAKDEYTNRKKCPIGEHGSKLNASDAHLKHCCPLCEFKTDNETNLEAHKQLHYPDDEMTYFCSKCPFTCGEKIILIRHEQVHMESKMHCCPHCDFKSSQEKNLEYHMMTHLDSQPYSCSKCEYKTSNMALLSKHIRTHTAAVAK